MEAAREAYGWCRGFVLNKSDIEMGCRHPIGESSAPKRRQPQTGHPRSVDRSDHRSAQLLMMDLQFVQMSLQLRQISCCDPQRSQDSDSGFETSPAPGSF